MNKNKYPIYKFVDFGSQEKLSDTMDYLRRKGEVPGNVVGSRSDGKARFLIKNIVHHRTFTRVARQEN